MNKHITSKIFMTIDKLFETQSKIKPITKKHLSPLDWLDKEYSIFRLGLELLKNFCNNHLFSGTIIAKLIHKILDYNIDTP